MRHDPYWNELENSLPRPKEWQPISWETRRLFIEWKNFPPVFAVIKDGVVRSIWELNTLQTIAEVEHVPLTENAKQELSEIRERFKTGEQS